MPAYSRDGVAEIAWASQKQYISLYVMRADVLDAHRRQLAGLDVGKGCIRYRNPAAIEFAVARSIPTAVALARARGRVIRQNAREEQLRLISVLP